jgi:single-stranded-DNA-specific exonuclease
MSLNACLSNQEKRWIVHPPQPEICKKFVQELSISPFLAQLLINRDITEPEQARLFLEGKLADLYSPWLLKDMDKAVSRINQALAKRESICIYGDYDVDGITGAALLSQVLTELGARHEVYIPHRLTEGYGVNRVAIEKIKQQGVQLIITVDCGITSEPEVALAKQLGMDVIITDHHQPPAKLPPACAILNPKQPGCSYPNDYLAGVGVAAKLAQALVGKEKAPQTLLEHLDLVCLGTVADVLPLIGENRILVKYGLQQLTNSPKLGIKVLKDVANLREELVSVWDIGFRLAPRLNAAGRVGNPYSALRLLLTSSYDEASRIARQLDAENQQRKLLEKQILADAQQQWKAQANAGKRRVIVLDSPDWHIGIVGIVASKLVEEFYLPTVLICRGTEPAKGSARSIPRFHLYDALTNCRSHLVGYGGHKYAAGITIKQADIPAFRDKLNQIALETLTEEDLTPQLILDGELQLDALGLDKIEDITQLAPFGVANPTPTFCARGLQIMKYPREVGQNHLKMKLRQGQKLLDGIGFNMGSLQTELCRNITSLVDVAFQPQLNYWQGKQQLQLKLKDLQFT